MRTRKGSIISDTHTGSLFGLMPPLWRSGKGETFIHNPFQEKLYGYWLNYLSETQDCDFGIHLAETVDGYNKKKQGDGTVTPNLNYQIEMAKEVLEPWAKGKTICGVAGSDYHGSIDTDIDRLVIEGLGGTYYGISAVLDLAGCDIKIHICHSSGGSFIYRATAGDRESLFLDAVEGFKLPYHIDLCLRGHWHWYMQLENNSRTMCYAPGWKGFDNWNKRNAGMFSRWLPDLGGLKLEITGSDFTIKKITYPHLMLLERPQRFGHGKVDRPPKKKGRKAKKK